MPPTAGVQCFKKVKGGGGGLRVLRLSLRERHKDEGAGECVREEWVDALYEGTERVCVQAQLMCSNGTANFDCRLKRK